MKLISSSLSAHSLEPKPRTTITSFFHLDMLHNHEIRSSLPLSLKRNILRLLERHSRIFRLMLGNHTCKAGSRSLAKAWSTITKATLRPTRLMRQEPRNLHNGLLVVRKTPNSTHSPDKPLEARAFVSLSRDLKPREPVSISIQTLPFEQGNARCIG